MKSTRITLMVLLLLAALLLTGGCSCKHYVDVYVNSKCALVDMDNDTAIDPLLVFPGDHVIFNNLTSEEVSITFPEGLFAERTYSIPGHKRIILEVLMKEPLEDTMTITCDPDGSGKPKVVVGEDP